MSSMVNGWQASANAWIADMGEHGDFGRRCVLAPVMLPRARAGDADGHGEDQRRKHIFY